MVLQCRFVRKSVDGEGNVPIGFLFRHFLPKIVRLLEALACRDRRKLHLRDEQRFEVPTIAVYLYLSTP
jgi:hypothetical protein